MSMEDSSSTIFHFFLIKGLNWLKFNITLKNVTPPKSFVPTTSQTVAYDFLSADKISAKTNLGYNIWCKKISGQRKNPGPKLIGQIFFAYFLLRFLLTFGYFFFWIFFIADFVCQTLCPLDILTRIILRTFCVRIKTRVGTSEDV